MAKRQYPGRRGSKTQPGAPYSTGGAGSAAGLAELRAQMEALSAAVVGLASLGAIDSVIDSGFASLTAQLLPLQNLAPQHKAMEAYELATLGVLRQSQSRPDWSGTGALEVQSEPAVRFIFQADPLQKSPAARGG